MDAPNSGRTAETNDRGGKQPSPLQLGAAVSWAFLLLAIAEFSLFAAVATRGFDVSDEGYYVLSMQHWRETPAHSLFAAYFDLPYRLVGSSLWKIRIFGFALLSAAASWFILELQRASSFSRDNATQAGLIAAAGGVAMIWDYYGGAFPVPLAPSYNLLALTCSLISGALALRAGRCMSTRNSADLLPSAIGFGIVTSIAVANKFTAGVLTALLDLGIFCTLSWGSVSLRRALTLAAASLGGLGLNLLFLSAMDPQWPLRIARGMTIQWAVSPRHPLIELYGFLRHALPSGMLRTLPALALLMALAMPLLAVPRRSPRRASLRALALITFTLGGLFAAYGLNTRPERIVAVSTIAVILACSAVTLKGIAGHEEKRRGILIALILALPFAYSFGTNNDLLRHMGMAVVFPLALAVSSIREIWLERAVPTWGCITSIGLIAVFPMMIPLQLWAPPELAPASLQEQLRSPVTYRLLQPLAHQIAPLGMNPGNIDVRVDPQLADALTSFLDIMRRTGFSAGDSMMDFTGQTPGLVALCGGVPVGSVWLLRGPQSLPDEAARIATEYEDVGKIRHAWLLTSPDSDGIRSWKSIVESKVHGFPYEHVASMLLPNTVRPRPQTFIHIDVWRPKSQ